LTRRAPGLFASLALVLLLLPGFGAGAEPDAQAKIAWQQHAAAIEAEYEQAHRELFAARADYGRERRRGRLRGAARKDANGRIQVALARVALADEARRSLPEKARRAGALPGWVR
jgi:hypothetical protein